MIYRWKPNTMHRVDAQVAGEELERIRTKHNGRLEPGMVVSASRAPAAPLHSAFEWNDAVAAEAWREDQASGMIRHITVDMEKPSGDTAPIRAFVSVKRDEDRSYTSVQHALSDGDLRKQVVAAAFSELVAWYKRHAELVEFAEIFALIEARAA
jgi:hypothetical protein